MATTRMRTYSGREFDLADPQWQRIDLQDIAISLSRINRFLGHTGNAYRMASTYGGVWSVAQHSIYVAELVAEILPGNAVARAYALLHDAHEPYVGDLSTIVKYRMKLLGFDFGAMIAAPVQRVVLASFALPLDPSAEIAVAVDTADDWAAAAEQVLFRGATDVAPPPMLCRPSPLLRMAAPETVAEMFKDMTEAALRSAHAALAGEIVALGAGAPDGGA